jgi:PIN domain nuclease of toxin-antitoxin system
MKLLLDTCTFLWAIGQAEQLSPKAREALENSNNALYFSQISMWEIQLKFLRGNLQLTDSPEAIITEGLRLHDIEQTPLDNRAIWHLAKLPTHHKDPFDRMLIASALYHGMQMVTPDPEIAKYPVPVIW